jgi:uncharacterized protein (DUF1810 family)
MIDSHDLQHFIDAQQPIYAQVCTELTAGAKISHWMWFIFPQLKELGRSTTARHYGIASRAEAEAYWRHPVLGARLKECTGLILAVKGSSALQIFKTPDDLKFWSCMTLFGQVVPEEIIFQRAIDQYFGGRVDAQTIELLRHGS